MNELEKAEKNESKLIKRFLLFSVLGHLVFALIYLLELPSRTKSFESIEAELVLTTNLNKPKKIPTKEKSKVHKNTLPQLTKNMVIKQNRPKNAVAIDSLKEKQEKEKKRKKRLKKLKYIELTKKQALQRLLRERARKNKEIARKEKLVLNESIKQLKSLNDDISILSAAGDGEYHGVVKSWIERHYELPEAYNIPTDGLITSMVIILNIEGEVVSVKITKPSKNSIFDRVAVQTVWKSSPVPKPPQVLVGKAIQINFTPQTF